MDDSDESDSDVEILRKRKLNIQEDEDTDQSDEENDDEEDDDDDDDGDGMLYSLYCSKVPLSITNWVTSIFLRVCLRLSNLGLKTVWRSSCLDFEFSNSNFISFNSSLFKFQCVPWLFPWQHFTCWPFSLIVHVWQGRHYRFHWTDIWFSLMAGPRKSAIESVGK